MKACLKILIIILFVFIFADSNCQVKIGYVFGMNISTLEVKSHGIVSPPSKQIGFHYGACFDIPFNSNFSFHPVIILSAKGSDYKIDSADYSLAPIFAEIPLFAMYSFGSKAVRFSLFAGPYFSYGVAGYKVDSAGDLTNIKYGSGQSSDLKPFDAGFNFGAGVNIKGTLISAQYGIGMSNLSTDPAVDSEMKNRVIGITISSAFYRK